MRITSPGRRELRRQLELSHRRIVHGGYRQVVAYKWSDQLSRVDLVVRVSAIARAAAEAEWASHFNDDGEIIEDDTSWVMPSNVWETEMQRKQRLEVALRDNLRNRTGRKAHHQP